MTKQIAVELPDDVLDRIDALVSEGVFANRSAAVREGLRAILFAHRRGSIDRAYEDGYGRLPETDEETLAATRLALESIKDEPREKWW